MGSGNDADTERERPGARAFLFDADGSDQEVDPTALSERTLDDPQLYGSTPQPTRMARRDAAGLGIEQGTTERSRASTGRGSRTSRYFRVICLFLGNDPGTTGRWHPLRRGPELDPHDAPRRRRSDRGVPRPIKGETQLGRVEGRCSSR
jgi:hypothetical protein